MTIHDFLFQIFLILTQRGSTGSDHYPRKNASHLPSRYDDWVNPEFTTEVLDIFKSSTKLMCPNVTAANSCIRRTLLVEFRQELRRREISYPSS